MALTIPQTSLQNPTTWTTWQAQTNLLGGFFTVAGNSAVVQILYGSLGDPRPSDTQTLPTGTYSLAQASDGRGPIYGIQAYNATSGLTATLGAYFYGPHDPVIQYISSASSTAIGTVNIPVTLLANWPPTSPSDGQTVFLELPASYDPVGATAVRWLAVWNAAASIWNVSGPSVSVFVAASQSPGSAAYVDLATVGPQWTVPVLGDYEVAIGCVETSGIANAHAYMSYAWTSASLGAQAASDAWAWASRTSSGGADDRTGGSRVTPITNATAASTVTAKYRQQSGQTATFVNRYMTIWPKRFR